MHSIDELRDMALGDGKTGRTSADALLQLRAKLEQISKLAQFTEANFSALDYVELCRLKEPQLC
jgi:hypothetical protein